MDDSGFNLSEKTPAAPFEPNACTTLVSIFVLAGIVVGIILGALILSNVVDDNHSGTSQTIECKYIRQQDLPAIYTSGGLYCLKENLAWDTNWTVANQDEWAIQFVVPASGKSVELDMRGFSLLVGMSSRGIVFQGSNTNEMKYGNVRVSNGKIYVNEVSYISNLYNRGIQFVGLASITIQQVTLHNLANSIYVFNSTYLSATHLVMGVDSVVDPNNWPQLQGLVTINSDFNELTDITCNYARLSDHTDDKFVRKSVCIYHAADNGVPTLNVIRKSKLRARTPYTSDGSRKGSMMDDCDVIIDTNPISPSTALQINLFNKIIGSFRVSNVRLSGRIGWPINSGGIGTSYSSDLDITGLTVTAQGLSPVFNRALLGVNDDFSPRTVTIRDSVINFDGNGGSLYSQATLANLPVNFIVENNVIRGAGIPAIYSTGRAAHLVVRQNDISSAYMGIQVWSESGRATISHNNINDCCYGVYVAADTTKTTITHNDFSFNAIDIFDETGQIVAYENPTNGTRVCFTSTPDVRLPQPLSVRAFHALEEH